MHHQTLNRTILVRAHLSQIRHRPTPPYCFAVKEDFGYVTSLQRNNMDRLTQKSLCWRAASLRPHISEVLTALSKRQHGPLHPDDMHRVSTYKDTSHFFHFFPKSDKSKPTLINLKWFMLRKLKGKIVAQKKSAQHNTIIIKWTVSIRASPHTFIKCHKTGYCIIGCLSYCFH